MPQKLVNRDLQGPGLRIGASVRMDVNRDMRGTRWAGRRPMKILLGKAKDVRRVDESW
jgi:hypothetical protein